MAIFTIADTSEIPDLLSMGREELIQRTTKEGAPKLSPDGRPTFSTGVAAIREGGGQDQGVTVAVIEVPKTPWPLGAALRAEGKAWLTPYVNQQGRQGLSFVVERLVPAKPAAVPGPNH